MFYGECYKCDERWELGTVSTCKCDPVLFTSHPYFYKRPWVGLTDEDMAEITSLPLGTCQMMLKVEAKLKEKNT